MQTKTHRLDTGIKGKTEHSRLERQKETQEIKYHEDKGD